MSRRIPFRLVRWFVCVAWSAISHAALAAEEADVFAGVNFKTEISVAAGLALPTEIGDVSADGLPAGTKLTFQNLPDGVVALPNAVSVERGGLHVPFTAAVGTPPGPFTAKAKLSRRGVNKEAEISLKVEPYDPFDAVRRCLRFQVPKDQPTQIPAGSRVQLRVDVVNLNMQPLVLVSGPAGSPPLIGRANFYLRRLGDDPIIPAAVFQGQAAGVMALGRYVIGGASIAQNKRQLPAGPFDRFLVNPVIVQRLPPGGYTVDFELYVNNLGATGGTHLKSKIQFEIVAP